METDPEAPGTPTDLISRAPASMKASQPYRETAMGPQSCDCSSWLLLFAIHVTQAKMV